MAQCFLVTEDLSSKSSLWLEHSVQCEGRAWGGHLQRRFCLVPRTLGGGFWKTGLGIGTQSWEWWGTTDEFYTEECFVYLLITMQNTKLYSLYLYI